MEKEGLLYIVTPIALLFIVYLLILTIAWPMARRHTFVPFYLLLLIVIFPPAFFFFIIWFYIIHLGFLSSAYYTENAQLGRPRIQVQDQQQPPQVQSQSERRRPISSSRV